MKTLNGYEVVDSQARQNIEELRQQVENIDPNTGGGSTDLSNYYTKDETYNKEEVDAKVANAGGGGGGGSADLTGYATEDYVDEALSNQWANTQTYLSKAISTNEINFLDYDPHEITDYQITWFTYVNTATNSQTDLYFKVPIANGENIIRKTAPAGEGGNGGWGQRVVFDLSDAIKARLLPEVTEADEGKTLKVVNGKWELV